MATITSAAGIIALLDEPELELQAFALEKLSGIVDDFWAEIADSITKIETLYEDEAFIARPRAALLASRVYFHLGELDQALDYALAAGQDAVTNCPNALYVSTIIAQAVDKYTRARGGDSTEGVDARLEAVVNAMFARCLEEGEFRQAVGIAIEARRLDVLTQAVNASGDVKGMLSYVFDVVMTLVPLREWRDQVLQRVCDLYMSLEEPDLFSVCQCAVVLNDSATVTRILLSLAGQHSNSTLLAYQLAFDLYARATQHFLVDVRSEIQAAVAAGQESPVSARDAERICDILMGKVSMPLQVEFLSRNNHTDLQILNITKDAIRNSSVLHQATVTANGFMSAGTTSDAFLRNNRDWLLRATNWAKFSAVASLGVVHKGQVHEAMNILSPYLPKDGVSSGSPYEKAGGLFALGLISANHGADLVPFLLSQFSDSQDEVLQHGACLGLGLAAMGSGNNDVYTQLKNTLYTDSAIAGEAAGIAIGLTMIASANEEVLRDLTSYATETQHEKIIRGLSVGIALVMYGRREEADTLIERLSHDKDPILRASACHTIALAYAGTNENKVIKQLLHMSVSDVNDDVRRAAVTALGFVLIRTPEQLPSVVMLLCESFNPHVRYGACMALGIACAGTGLAEAIELVEPLVKDPTPFVRQGACIALGMIMLQQPNSHPKSDSIRKLFSTIIAEKHEDVLAKYGAIYAQGIIEASGRNATISVCRDHGHMDTPSVVGLLVFTQFWFWFPLGHFLSLAFHPTAMICVNGDLKMPKIEVRSNIKPSAFAYPPNLEVPKEKEKEKVVTAVLSISAKGKTKAGAADKSKAADGAAPMEVDEKKDEEKKKEEEKKKSEPEPDFELLSNPARVVPAQVKYISFPDTCRYKPVRPDFLNSGIIVLQDSTPGEEEELIDVKLPTSSSGASTSDANEPAPPPPFEFNPDVEDESASTA